MFLNTLYREELNGSPSDLVFFQHLRLPGDFFTSTPPSPSTFSQELITQMKHFAASFKPTATRVVQSKQVYLPPELTSSSHVFVKVDSIKPSLLPFYAGLFFVLLGSPASYRQKKNQNKLRQFAGKMKKMT